LDDYEKLAGLLFSDLTVSPDELEQKYPPRNLPDGARVSRFAPSPTGFMHMGNIFSAFISKLNADITGGVFYLRIEDTDKKREVENGIESILDGLFAFGIVPDEGVVGQNEEKGGYGPYRQSRRKEIYRCFAKELVKKGFAYPCFCTEDDLAGMRKAQDDESTPTKGYFGKWAVCRSLTFDEQRSRILSGAPFVLRLRSDGDENKKITVRDLIKGKIEMPENIQDIVLLKSDGIPTYHFAHAVDDHLMRTTHVVRGDEWIASLPVHIQLFSLLGFKPPKYVHISPIMKIDNGNKRKLSKRKDPELAVSFYREQGYPTESVLEYLMTLANSNFEDWRRANPAEPLSRFPFSINKMSPSGAVFDIAKMNDISKNIISKMGADEIFEKVSVWASEFDPELYMLLSDNPKYAKSIFSIDRGGTNPRKDISKWSDVRGNVEYFYPALYKSGKRPPESITAADARAILSKYLEVYGADDEKDVWFSKIKGLCEPLGFTPNVKEFKKNPSAFKGHVGDVSAVIRMAVTSRANTPDLHAVMALLGEREVKARINGAIDDYTLGQHCAMSG
jgi:glutamyl-tRNA synthetase